MNELVASLSSFDKEVRRQSLEALADEVRFLETGPAFNMHLHSFFSFSGGGWSPSRIAYEMKKRGMYSAAVCDFDVLHGVREFLEAGDLLQLRAAAGLETRAFFSEYAEQEINSPGEPGVFYFMGMGFVGLPDPESFAGKALKHLLDSSYARNCRMIFRINQKLRDLNLSYVEDVYPLTPEKNPTERHIVRAYYDKAIEKFGMDGAAEYWSDILHEDLPRMKALIGECNPFNELLRSRLMKRGGIGYEEPTSASFPLLESVIGMIRECRAIPMTAWLDGSSEGEADPLEQLECLRAKGVEAVNIIPDRNWNIKDADKKAKNIAALNEYVNAAQMLEMPINVGTEGNKPGQILVDEFASEPLWPHYQAFRQGARVMVGHTRMLRWADFSFVDDAAFAGRKERNEFFAAVGALPAPGPEILARLDKMLPGDAYAYLADSAKAETWR